MTSQPIKLTKKIVIGIVACALLAIAMIVFSFVPIKYSSDKTVNTLVHNCIIRAIGSMFAVLVCILGGLTKRLNPKRLNGIHSLIWCIPCLLVVLANFPYSALILQTARITRTDLIWLFSINCLLIGVYEELLFRGLLQSVVAEYFTKNRYSTFWTVLVTAALFSVWHFLNILDGASFGATLMQAGYSFLIGAMLSAVVIKTGNIWLCVMLHAVFDFGGMIVTTLGYGDFQDVCFWILTAVIGALCFAHVLLFLIKKSAPHVEQ